MRVLWGQSAWLLAAVVWVHPAPGAALAETVREDWYVRESLRAIRDWEQTLARLDSASPPVPCEPVIPVPETGAAAIWPNPVPRMLLPAADRGYTLRLSMRGGRVRAERAGGARPPEGEQAATFAPGEMIEGYRHPGGGDKDQWYHAYHRRFDRVTAFQAKASPFSVELAAPLDLGLGQNGLAVTLRNTSGQAARAAVRLDQHGPDASPSLGAEKIELQPGEGRTLRFAVRLDGPGGGLLMLTIEAGGETFRLPILTHVEDVPAVLAGVEKALADQPDAAAADRLADLRRRARQLLGAGEKAPGPAWRALFEEASALRDAVLLERVPYKALLFVKRKPFFSEQPFMDAHHLFNRPGGGIYRLEPPRPGGRVTPVVDRLGEGVYRDVCLHWDAGRFLFAFGNGSDKWDGRQSYHLYESDVEGRQVRQVTTGPRNDCEPVYLPDGRIGFTSDRSGHFVMCGGDRHAPTLFATSADGSRTEQLSYNVFNDFNPTVLPDGRILYSRWEYNERSVTSLHNPFTANPDGTMVSPYYGNATIRPNVVMFPRPVPGSPKVMALFTAHHGQTHGAVGLIDRRRGVDGDAPLEVLTPGVPVTGEKALDSQHGWYSDPVPISETAYLCSFTPTVVPWHERTWAIYAGDQHGNLALIYRDPEISCAEPVPIVRRARPHEIPRLAAEVQGRAGGQSPFSPADSSGEGELSAAKKGTVPGPDVPEATLVLADVYVGLTGVPRGTARYLRVLEDVPRKDVDYGGVVLTSGTEIFTIKRVWGTAPIEPDGSAHFAVPPDRNLYFEVLDADRREIQRMRSVVCLRPGEVRSCIGCHERRTMAPPPVGVAAAKRPASRLGPPPWGTQIVSFLRDVQPVLNARCVECHAHDRQACGVILTDDLTDRFTVAYEELLPYVEAARANRWDTPEDVYPRPPYTYGSKVSRLAELLAAGHQGVKLTAEERDRIFTWIDCNAVYYDRYETNALGPQRQIFGGQTRKTLEEVFARRCASCHGRGDGQQDTWWLSLNRRNPAQSRALIAPLAKAAGGWQRCGEPVFAGANDPDYQKMLGALAELRARLEKDPRADLLSIRGTAAERQEVVLPAPPPSGKPADEAPPDGPWVHLSDLEWESAAAGWSANGDKLPRRDRDAENQPLRLGRDRYRKGIGTHAPSEIVVALDGKYERFQATVGGAEKEGSVVFEVYGDGRKLFSSGTMRGLEGVRTVDVPLEGVRRLRLVVTDAGDNYYADMANWAAARLRPAGAAPGRD